MVALYNCDPSLYFGLLRFDGLDPWFHPFIDSEFLYAMKNCWLHGVDIYQAVPCDVVVRGTKMAYSPLWQRLPFLPSDVAARVPIGMASDLAFLGALPLLPAARSGREAVFMSLAVISTMVCFALERNNIDVWMFLLVAGGVQLIIRGGIGRYCGYGVFMLAGLLKYYPFALFALAARERLPRLLLIAGGVVLGIAVFVLALYHDLIRSVLLIPTGSPVGDLVGITNIPIAVSEMAGGPSAALINLLLRLLLTSAVVALAIRVARQREFSAAFADMDNAGAIWLVSGCLLMGGCYLLGQNVSYRGIYLLIVLSGFLAMRRAVPGRQLGAGFSIMLFSILPLMWMEAMRHWADLAFGLPGVPHLVKGSAAALLWFARELLWLNLARWLLAIPLLFAAQSTSFRELGDLITRLKKPRLDRVPGV